jgi:uncharacterized glyoxalase superfamily protein PhnB
MARGTKITPVLRYRNPRTAARWLCEAFGFHEHDTAQEADGQVRYVLLRLGDSFVLVRPVANLGFDDLLVQPEAVGGANTQVCYVTVSDADEHRARAGAAGARIEIEPQDDGLGGQFYTCRDLEGHLWGFGTLTYGVAGTDADESQSVEPSRQRSTALAVVHPPRRAGRGLLLRSAGAAAAVAVFALGGWIAYRTYAGPNATLSTALSAQVEDMREQLAQERNRRSAAEDASRDAAAKLAEERTAAADARQTLQRAQAELARERREKDEALTALASSKTLAEEQVAQEQAQRAALARSASEQAVSLQEQLAKLHQDSRAERERLNETKAALLTAQAELERLRTGMRGTKAEDGNPAPAIVTGQIETAKSGAAQPPDAQQASAADPGTATGSVPDENPPEAKAPDPKTACVSAVQGKVAFGNKASSTWAEANLARLCQGAETSVEPGKCFEELMRGKVSWGGGRVWTGSNALALCAGTRNARRTLDCFATKLAAEETWQAAIRQCRAS